MLINNLNQINLLRRTHLATAEQSSRLPSEQSSSLPAEQASQTNSLSEISLSNNLIDAVIFTQMMNSINSTIVDNTNLRKKFEIHTKINEYKLSESCDCDICYENLEKDNFIKLNCGHEFCKVCIKKSLENEKKDKFTCAFCRAEINEFQLSNQEIRHEFNDLIV
jgi:hypothetical protein